MAASFPSTRDGLPSGYAGSRDPAPPAAPPPLLEQRRADDDGPREHEPRLGAEGVEAEDLAQVADGERADQGQPPAAAAAREAGAADDHHGDGVELVAHPRLGIAVRLL